MFQPGTLPIPALIFATTVFSTVLLCYYCVTVLLLCLPNVRPVYVTLSHMKCLPVVTVKYSVQVSGWFRKLLLNFKLKGLKGLTLIFLHMHSLQHLTSLYFKHTYKVCTLYTSIFDLKNPLPQSWTYASTVSVVNVTAEAKSCHKLFHYLVSWMFTVDIVDCSVLTQLTLLTVDCWLCWQFNVDTVDSPTIFQYWDISQTEAVVLYDDHLLLTICCSSYYGVSMLPLIVSIVARC